MTPSPFSQSRLQRPATGVPGAARPRALLGWGGVPGALPGVASARLVAGTLAARPLREGLAACGQPSTVGGGRGGGEPFYLDRCGCGGACGRDASCACPGCAAGAHANRAGGAQPAATPARFLPPGPNAWALRNRGQATHYRTVPDVWNPPTSSSCQTDCTSAMVGDADGCAMYAPSKNVSTLDASALATAEDIGAGTSLVPTGFTGRVFWTATSAEVSLVNAAFGLLVQDLDLVNWAFCLGRGMWDVPGLLRIYEYILGLRGMSIAFVEADFDGAGVGMAVFGTNIVWLNRSAPSVAILQALWESDDQDQRACAAIMMSSILLHELTHLSGVSLLDVGGWSGVEAGQPYQCYSSFMISNPYQWAMYQRYPNAGSPSCCLTPAGNDVFACNLPQYPDAQCDGSVPPMSWSEEVDAWFDDAGASLGRWFAGLFDTSGGGPTGFDIETCKICPELCVGMSPSRLGAEEGTLEECLSRFAEAALDDSEPDALGRV